MPGYRDSLLETDMWVFVVDSYVAYFLAEHDPVDPKLKNRPHN